MRNPTNELHTDHTIDSCPMAKAVRLVGDMWILLIVRALMDGNLRFNELQDTLGHCSSGTLSQRLKLLETHGLISRHAYAEIPPRVEYKLTEKGLSLVNVVTALGEFGERYLCEDTPLEEAKAPGGD